MLENVSPVGNRSGSSSSSSQHLMVQQHQHHFQQQQQQQQSNEDIKRDLSDMCGQQSAGQQENMQTDHDADDSDLHHQHHQQQQQHKETQYISANCVVFMSYSGDTASVVDQHFSRALNSTQPESAGGGGGGGSSGSPYADASSAGSSGGSNNSQKTSSGISLVKSKSPNFLKTNSFERKRKKLALGVVSYKSL